MNSIKLLSERLSLYEGQGKFVEAAIMRRLISFAKGELPNEDTKQFWDSHLRNVGPELAPYQGILPSREFMRLGMDDEAKTAIQSITKHNLSSATQALNLISFSTGSIEEIKSQHLAVEDSLSLMNKTMGSDLNEWTPKIVRGHISKDGPLALISYVHYSVLKAIIDGKSSPELFFKMIDNVIEISLDDNGDHPVGKEAWNALLFLSFFINASGTVKDGESTTKIVCGFDGGKPLSPAIIAEIVRAKSSYDIQFMFASFQYI